MIVWEAHACLPLHPHADFAPLDGYRAAGVDYVSVNVGMDMNPLPQVLAVIAGFRTTIAAHPDRYVAGLERRRHRARGRERAASRSASTSKGAMPLLEQPEMVALYRDLGVRQIHFAYNRNNSVADGCHDVERGLTPLGRRMVAAVNDAGLLMDCSHTGRRCSLDIMAASRATGDLQPLQSAGPGRARAQRHRRADPGMRGDRRRDLRVGRVGVPRHRHAHGRRRGAPRGVRRRSRRRRARRASGSTSASTQDGIDDDAAGALRSRLLVAEVGRLRPGDLAHTYHARSTPGGCSRSALQASA